MHVVVEVAQETSPSCNTPLGSVWFTQLVPLVVSMITPGGVE
jgi:uncharacterized protein (UPF0212 family)